MREGKVGDGGLVAVLHAQRMQTGTREMSERAVSEATGAAHVDDAKSGQVDEHIVGELR